MGRNGARISGKAAWENSREMGTVNFGTQRQSHAETNRPDSADAAQDSCPTSCNGKKKTNNPEIEFEGHAKIAAKLTKTRFNPSASGHGATAGQFYWPFEILFKFVALTEKLKTLDILSNPVPRPGLIQVSKPQLRVSLRPTIRVVASVISS